MPHPIALTGGTSPIVLGNFAVALGDYTTLSTLSTMPTGGSISRSGNAMLYDSTGKLTYAPNNIALQNNTFATSPWYLAGGTALVSNTNNSAQAPDGTTTAGTLVTGAGYASWGQNITANAGDTFIVSVWAKVSSGTSTLSISGASLGSNNTIDTTWKRVYFASTFTTSGTKQINFNLGASSTFYLWGAQVELVTYQTTPSGTYFLNYPTPTTTAAYYGPRFDTDPATLLSKGLLVEGTRTNIAPYSQAFNSWNGNSANVTISADTSDTTAPDGSNTADKLTRGATTGSEAMARYINALSTSTTYTYSVYAKAGSASTYLYIRILGTDSTIPGGLITVDLSNGNATVGSAFTSAVKVTLVANGWYRVSVTAKTASTFDGVNYFNMYDVGVSGSSTNITGAADLYLYVWGMQVEAGDFVTSYLPNPSTGTTTRAAETFTLANYTSRLVESFYIDEQTGGSWSANIAASATSPLTISTPTFGWVTSLRAYQNAYAGDIATPVWIDNSGTTGNRMYYDSTGMLTWAPANMVVYSEDFRNTTDAGSTRPWQYDRVSITPNATTAPDGTLTADLETLTGVSYAKLTQNIIFVSGTTYIYSVYVKADTASSVTLRIQGYTISSAIVVSGPATAGSSGSGGCTFTNLSSTAWSRIAIVATANTSVTGEINIYVGNWSSQTVGQSIYVWGAQLEPVTYQQQPRLYIPTTDAAKFLPRYDYDPSTTPATPRGMLIEESRDNLCKYSQQLDNAAWTQTSTTVTPDQITAPDGTTTADKVLTTVNTYSNTFNSAAMTVVGGSVYTASVYLKAGVGTGVQLRLSDTVTGQCLAQINPSTGSISVYSASVYGSVSVTSQNVGNGWYRYSMTGTQPAGQTTAIVGLYIQNTNDYVYAWGFQHELGSFATSYVPTVSSSTTRVADIVKLSGSALTTLQGSNVSIITQYVQNPFFDANAAPARGQLWCYTDTGNSRLSARASDIPDNNPAFAVGNGSTVSTIRPLAYALKGTSNRFAVAYSTTTQPVSISLNGATAVTAATTFAGGITGVNLGSNNATGASQFNSWAASLAIYNQRLPDAILKAKSTVGAAY